jgi:uncharacterized protein (DUF342 family)/CheY-like chemotaxis protein
MQNLLSDHGYQVNSFSVSQEALEALETAMDEYALIISSYMMPKMKGDEILKQAKSLAPDTQRLLISDTDDMQTLISAINFANINACLILPIQDDEFLNQVKLCCDQYDITKKQKNLKRVIHRQNKQLFQIASNLKKKDTFYSEQIGKKKKEIRILESRLRSAGGSFNLDTPVLLNDLLSKQDGAISAESLGGQFLTLKEQIKQIIETAASSHYLSLSSIAYQDAVDPKGFKNEHRDLAKHILPSVYAQIEKDEISGVPNHKQKKEVILDEQFELTVSKDKTRALIQIKTREIQNLTLAHVKQFLEKNKIINGVMQSHLIEEWLHKALPDDEPFLIAKGIKAIYPKDAKIRYHFPTDFLHAGKVNEDGSINFRDRGDIPCVEEDAFLASKILPEESKPGIDIFGKKILVDAPVDQTFSCGSGARMSEDGVRIYAVCSGQPHLDAMGNVSVCPEFQIKGDLGFETGDVNFDGNVVVNGSVKQGFKVKCASLTAQEIQGAQIDIEGDLNVSMGIIDTELVKVKGSVQAKFVHNSKINAFGDLIVQREIIDSRIYLSGACINENGSIVNSEISAKMGIRAANIGKQTTKPSKLTVGVDEHTNLLVARVDSKLNINTRAINELASEVDELVKEDHALHGVISQHAYVQDRAQLELQNIEKKMENLKASGNMAAFQKVSNTVKEIQKNAAGAEEKINKGFDRQDEISQEISQKKGRIEEFEEMNKSFSDEKKRLLEFSNRNEPLAEIKVAKKIESGTKIFAVNSSMILHNSKSRCRIREFSSHSGDSGGIAIHEMRIEEF